MGIEKDLLYTHVMNAQPPIAARMVPCPVCGYDLRATARVAGEARCPECGTVSHELAASRIPWVQRRQRGRIKAYLQTLWMVLRRPGELAREVEGRLGRRDAARFELISRILATVVGAGLAGLAIAGDHPNPWPLDDRVFWLTPLIALADSWWGLLPLAVGVYLALWMNLGIYRWVFCLRERGIMRRRMGRMVTYAAALLPLEAFLTGSMFLTVQLRATDHGTDEIVGPVIAGLGLVAGVVFLWPTLAIIANGGQAKGLRGALMVAAYPVIAVAVFVGTLLPVVWAGGYTALAIRSMGR